MYKSITDAAATLLNSGVIEMFDYKDLGAAARHMYDTDSTPEEAAKFFGVL